MDYGGTCLFTAASRMRWSRSLPFSSLIILDMMLIVVSVSPPPPSSLVPKSPPPPPPDYSISTKCSNILNASQQLIMTVGGEHSFFIKPMVIACEEYVCTAYYKAFCSTKWCPYCKLYTGSASRLKVVVDMNGEKTKVSCSVNKVSVVYMATCMVDGSAVNITNSYRLRVYAEQVNGTITPLDDTLAVVFQAGALSAQNSGPGFWPNGDSDDLAVGQLATFTFPVRDKYGNLKKNSNGAATLEEIRRAFGQFETNNTSNMVSRSVSYDSEIGYVSINFIPTALGTWSLLVGHPETGYILSSPYDYTVAIAGPISSENCLAVWSSKKTAIMAGDLAYLTIYLKDSYNNTVNVKTGWSDIVNFTVTVTEMLGKICQKCALLTAAPGVGYEMVTINITAPGSYKINISDESRAIKGSPLNFSITAGLTSAKRCVAYWLNNETSFKAGGQVLLKVLLMDSYNNNISASTGRNTFIHFNVFSNSSTGLVNYRGFNVTAIGDSAYESITFSPTLAGDFLLHIEYNDLEISNSPLNFSVAAGQLSIFHSEGFWLDDVNTFTAGEQAVLQVLLMDSFRNNITLPSGFINFTTFINDPVGQVISTNIQQNVDQISEYQLVIFNTTISGNLSLYIEKNGTMISGSPFLFHVDPGEIFPSSCGGFWPDEISTFHAGETGTFGVVYKDSYNNTLSISDISLNVSANIQSVNGSGNFSILNINPEDSIGYGTIDFVSFSSGELLMYVYVNNTQIRSSPFSFQVTPGSLYAPKCEGMWVNDTNKFQAGTCPSFQISLIDVYGNNASLDTRYYDFGVSSMTDQGTYQDMINLTASQDTTVPYKTIGFTTTTTGNFSLDIEYNGTVIKGSPFTYSVIPGPVSVSHCIGFWKNGSGLYTIDEQIVLDVTLRDSYKNNITISTGDEGIVNLTTKIQSSQGQTYETNITVQVQTVYETITFISKKAGDFLLYVGENDIGIEGSPFPFTVTPGPISSSNCQVLWLNNTEYVKAGDQGGAEVLFMDVYNNSVSDYINFTMYFTRDIDGEKFEDVSVISKREDGHQFINFMIVVPGEYSLHFVYGGVELNGSPLSFVVIPGSLSPSHCRGVWSDDVHTISLGDSGSLKVFLMDSFNNIISTTTKEAEFLKYSAYVTTKSSSQKSPVTLKAIADESNSFENVTLTPKIAGDFMLYVFINQIQISGSPFELTVQSAVASGGIVYVPNCLGKWQNGTNVFKVGQQATLDIALRDATNTILISPTEYNFMITLMDLKGRRTKMRPKQLPSNELGYDIVTFNTTTKGSFLLYIGDASSQIKNSPFLFHVLPTW